MLSRLRRGLDNERDAEGLKTRSVSWLGVSASVEGETRKTQGEAIRRTMLQFCFACAGGRSTREPKLDTRVGFWDSDLGVIGEQVMREWGRAWDGRKYSFSICWWQTQREAWTSGGCPWSLGGWGQEDQKFLSPAFLSSPWPMTQTEGMGGGNKVQFTVGLLPLPF